MLEKNTLDNSRFIYGEGYTLAKSGEFYVFNTNLGDYETYTDFDELVMAVEVFEDRYQQYKEIETSFQESLF